MKTPKHTPVTPINPQFARKPLAYLVGSLAVVSCLAGTQANAQDAKPAAEADVIQVIDIIGSRQAEESAINRKKKAKTAMDSIIAEDVGKMPDSNIGEAISRISGVGLDRGDTGEGVGISVRGEGADTTRIEIDGQAMMSGGGAASSMNGTLADGAGGRGQGVRDLPADLIKSVDVIKGSTADMSEGSLGGGVQIKTRSALDFKKRYSSIKLSGTQNSLNPELSPTYTVVLADQFLDGRLGVMFNASGAKITNEGHSSAISDNSRGYDRRYDLDNSPEKTFSFNPSTLDTNTATNPTYNTPFTSVATKTGTWNSESPLSFLTKAAGAKTKADCYTLFPGLTAAENGNFSSPTSTAAVSARNQRSLELVGCLNQWNDFTPQNTRYFIRRDDEQRNNMDLRFDFKVNDDLTVYAKGSKSERDIYNTFATYTNGGTISSNPATGQLNPTYNGAAFTTTAGITTAVAGSGFYTNPNNVVASNALQPTGIAGIQNNVINVVPGSAVVDANHHVTSYSYTNGRSALDQQDSDQNTNIQYFQFGGTYEKDNLNVEFMVGDARSTFTRNDFRIGWGRDYGAGTATLNSNGFFVMSPAEGLTFDQSAASSYTNMLAPTAAIQPSYSANTMSFNQGQSRRAETIEQTAKVDVSYKFEDKIPFLTEVKGGLNYRTTDIAGWGAGGGTISVANGTTPAVTLGNNNARGSIRACENTAGSLGVGGVPCAYGSVPDVAPGRGVTVVVNQQQLQNMIEASMYDPGGQFMEGMNGRGDNFIDKFSIINVKKFYQLAGAINHLNLDCIKECLGSDGNVYKQPVSRAYEENLAGYLMADFEFKDLPFDMEATSNIGVRAVETNVDAHGFMFFNSITKSATFDPLNPNVATGILTSAAVFKNVDLEKSTTNVLPSFNFALWTIPDVLVARYSRGTTLARPSIPQMLPSGTCTYDIRKLDQILEDDGTEVDQGCGVFGNPGLKPYENVNQNLSLEWYPNKGQMFSAAIFTKKSKIGGPVRVNVADAKVLSWLGDAAVDPVTGAPLSDVEYSYSTYVNGVGADQQGFELSSKSSFTFLPWKFQYTGIDLNYSRLDFKTGSVAKILDLNSGNELPPKGLVSSSFNASLWYDDGHLSARVSFQHRAEKYNIFTRGGNDNASGSNYQGVGMTDWVRWTPYNPGYPLFEDATDFVDAKISYKFKNGLDIGLEGRNLTNQPIVTSSGGYYDFADGTPNVNEYKYFGRKITASVNYKF